MSNLNVWISDGQLWACPEYDHGPMCRRCRKVDGITVKPEQIGEILTAMGLAVVRFEVNENGFPLTVALDAATREGWATVYEARPQ